MVHFEQSVEGKPTLERGPASRCGTNIVGKRVAFCFSIGNGIGQGSRENSGLICGWGAFRSAAA
ncbi:hypothetical protein HAALTHF_25390n [Vreelandella aquamarina]|nr:hypothetical protein HAALTHF_25390n [Halomonas axialensis]